MFGRKKDKELDVTKLNEVIRLSKSILNIVLVLLVLVCVYVVSSLMTNWKILPFLLGFIKILAPLFIGLIIAWLFDPLVTKLSNKNINRILSTFIVFIGFLGIFSLVIALIVPSISSQINEVASSIPTIVENTSDYIENIFNDLEEMTDYDLSETEDQIFASMTDFATTITTELPTTVVSIISSIISGGVTLVFGLIIGFYMLFDFHNVKKHLFTFIPRHWQKDAQELSFRLNKSLRSFVQGTLTIALILFCFQSIGLSIAGLKAPLVFGLFCAITNIIPYVGPWLGGIPVVIIGFTQEPIVGMLALVSVLIAQGLESYFLQPVVMGKTMKLHPVTIMIGLLIFGHYFGIIGMIFATPIISTAKLIFNFFDEKYGFMDKITHDVEILKNAKEE